MKKTALAKKKAKLTLKQAAWIKEYLKTGNATRSAEKVYDVSSYKAASVIASENLEKLRPHVAHLMENKGVSIGRLIDKLNEKLDAKRIHGTSDDFIEVDDNVAQLKALEIASKWIGLDGKIAPNIQVNILNEIKKQQEDYGI